MEDFTPFELNSGNTKFPDAYKVEPSIVIKGENVLTIILDAGSDNSFDIALLCGGEVSSIPFNRLKKEWSIFIPAYFKGFSLQVYISSTSKSIVKGKLKIFTPNSQVAMPSEHFPIPNIVKR